MHKTQLRRLLVGALLMVIAASAFGQPRPGQASPGQPTAISYWGMNAYFTKGGNRLNPNKDNVPLLQTMAKNAGVHWTREELPWGSNPRTTTSRPSTIRASSRPPTTASASSACC